MSESIDDARERIVRQILDFGARMAADERRRYLTHLLAEGWEADDIDQALAFVDAGNREAMVDVADQMRRTLAGYDLRQVQRLQIRDGRAVKRASRSDAG
jgi:hypothetical protein